MHDYLVIGGGPAGLACALRAKKRGASCLVLEKGSIVNSIQHFPRGMTFFSTPELLQLDDALFVSGSFRPPRREVVHYYLSLVKHFNLDVLPFHRVTAVAGSKGAFRVAAETRTGNAVSFAADKVIIATGYYDNPNLIGVPGEELPHVSHYFDDPLRYAGARVAVVGGRNSAAEAAIALHRAGAAVTLVHRGAALGEPVKYWIRPDIEKLMERGKVRPFFNSAVTAIEGRTVRLATPGGPAAVEADAVFLLTGYHPDHGLMASCGIRRDAATQVPEHDPRTLQTNVTGLYLAGSVSGGVNCNSIFIENSRHHPALIVG